MQVAVLLFDRITASEAVIPYEVLSRLPGADVTFVGERVGPVRSDTGRLALTADAVLEELPHPDVVVVPGGDGRHRHMRNGSVHRWLRGADPTARWMIGIGDGALIIAAAGLLRGRKVASYRSAAHAEFEFLGAIPLTSGMVLDERYATAAGGGCALALTLEVARRAAGPETADRIEGLLASAPRFSAE